jgi:pyridoxal/pyridoxine/pyridoxamine kinase
LLSIKSGLLLLDGKRQVWKVISHRLEGIFTGTGDLFAALFLGWVYKLGCSNLPKVLETTLETMQVVLQRTKVKGDEDKKKREDKVKFRPQELQLVQSLDVILKPPTGQVGKAVEVPSSNGTNSHN